MGRNEKPPDLALVFEQAGLFNFLVLHTTDHNAEKIESKDT
jgi:hypothetical protein